MDGTKIKRLLNIPHEIICFDTVDSTNILAKENSGMPEGTVFTAEKQNKGRGRNGKIWESGTGGLFLSLLIKPDISPDRLSVITLIAGMAANEAINKKTGGGAMIKWPNDVVISGKKISGILTELNRDMSVVAGVGINVNNESFEGNITDIATSLYIECGKKYEKEEIAAEFLNEFDRFYDIFLDLGFEALTEEYSNNCVTLNKNVRVVIDGRSREAEAVGVDSKGRLVVVSDGVEEYINAGEVSVRGILGYI